MKKRYSDIKGFTLIELLVALSLFGIVAGVFFIILNSIQVSHRTHSRGVDLRQNLRASLDLMAAELMIAGSSGFNYKDLKVGTADTGIEAAGRNSITFTSDTDNNGVLDRITYSLVNGSDDDSDGEANAALGSVALVRTFGDVSQVMMDDVQAIQFAYAFDDDGDNQLDFTDTDGDGVQDPGEEIIWAYASGGDQLNTLLGGTAMATGIDLKRIRMVRIWLLGRTSVEIRKTNDTNTYNLGSLNVSGINDKFQRFLISTTVKCRNMGS